MFNWSFLSPLGLWHQLEERNTGTLDWSHIDMAPIYGVFGMPWPRRAIETRGDAGSPCYVGLAHCGCRSAVAWVAFFATEPCINCQRTNWVYRYAVDTFSGGPKFLRLTRTRDSTE